MKKYTDYEEAKAAREEAKETLKSAKAAFRDFKKENGKTADEIEDKKLKKEFNKLEAAVTAAEEELDNLNAQCKELRPAPSGNFAAKYTYPEGMTDPKEKKKYRAKMRREANGAEEGEEKEEKASKKKAKKEDAPEKETKEAPVAKEEKASKKKKKNAKVEDEEED